MEDKQSTEEIEQIMDEVYRELWEEDDEKGVRNVYTPGGNQQTCKGGNKYTAQIQVSSKKINLGTFDTPDEAREAYEQAKMKLDLQALMG
jgi:hypothetical protein